MSAIFEILVMVTVLRCTGRYSRCSPPIGEKRKENIGKFVLEKYLFFTSCTKLNVAAKMLTRLDGDHGVVQVRIIFASVCPLRLFNVSH